MHICPRDEQYEHGCWRSHLDLKENQLIGLDCRFVHIMLTSDVDRRCRKAAAYPFVDLVLVEAVIAVVVENWSQAACLGRVRLGPCREFVDVLRDNETAPARSVENQCFFLTFREVNNPLIASHFSPPILQSSDATGPHVIVMSSDPPTLRLQSTSFSKIHTS